MTMLLRLAGLTVGLMVGLMVGPVTDSMPHRRWATRDERGLSQSTENAILLAGAVAVAGIVIAAITIYVTAKMPKP